MKRLSLVLGAVAAAALLAFAWAVMLRKQVNHQLHLLQDKTQTEAVLEERQRIAREFHDTLEQELAGLTIRLDAATTRVTDVKARELLEQQRHLLSRLQTESRDFVWDLRDSTRHTVPLDKALHALLAHLQATTAVTLQLECPEGLPEIPQLAQHHLLCITREATNNAIKYAEATTIKVIATYDPTALKVSIADNGKGFDVTAKDKQIGHFGLQGMQERARKIQADLQIHSSTGQGTRVELSLALPVMPV
jgi:signal transduction histidine kinase